MDKQRQLGTRLRQQQQRWRRQQQQHQYQPGLRHVVLWGHCPVYGHWQGTPESYESTKSSAACGSAEAAAVEHGDYYPAAKLTGGVAAADWGLLAACTSEAESIGSAAGKGSWRLFGRRASLG